QVVADALTYLVPEQVADIILFEGLPVSVELPIKVERKVIEAPPAVKGNTSTNVMKNVVVEGGMKVKAPLFIKADDIIRLDTRYGTYVERVTS
ncbi:elongation factor P, partial [Patescibacteria group bacterium]|nr:elongation factor P [Patescibacteria group bacterium]